ncbi:unnamed protein product [Rotaria socialis]|nr:unnamed protein product [Rotaria socialis]CAF3443399.1 unnamed protein product [Rotaria socialis]CAF4131124.1 unnamed protein product [Rotaria socialis]CAF4184469.1 unnamed protein product [Rotaria socialis]CAF4572267.1 unnamed protein product [Rotaria socialis]
MVEIEITPISTLIGVVYVPPCTIPPFHLFTKCRNKSFCIFGDFNAKHVDWKCEVNNVSGSRIVSWLEETGNEMILPDKPTSRRSDAIIDFGLTHDATGWHTEVLEEGTSDHFPVLIQSPLNISDSAVFRKTNWNIFKFFLSCVYEYWLARVYNYDEQFFFTHFSLFLQNLWDRCSCCKPVKQYRPSWPSYLVMLAKEMNRSRRRYRRNKTIFNLNNFIELKKIFNAERSELMKHKYEKRLELIKKDQNIWKIATPIFHLYSPPFRGLNVNNTIIKETASIVEILANHYEKHFAEHQHDENNIVHQKCISIYEQLGYMPNIPLDKISINEVSIQLKKYLQRNLQIALAHLPFY